MKLAKGSSGDSIMCTAQNQCLGYFACSFYHCDKSDHVHEAKQLIGSPCRITSDLDLGAPCD
jgi:hypothetical protein